MDRAIAKRILTAKMQSKERQETLSIYLLTARLAESLTKSVI